MTGNSYLRRTAQRLLISVIVLGAVVVGPSAEAAYPHPAGHQDGARGGAGAAFAGSNRPAAAPADRSSGVGVESRPILTGSTQEPGDSDSITTASLFKAMSEGAAGQVGGELAGYLLGLAGIGGSDAGTDSQTVSWLQTIDSDLQRLQTTIEDLDCGALTDDIKNSSSAINTWFQEYSSFTDNVNDGLPPGSELENWLAAVLSDETDSGLAFELNSIHQHLVSEGGQGALAACLATGIVPLPQPGTLGDDENYYDDAQQVVNWYFMWQTYGLSMLVDAYHTLATQSYQDGVTKYGSAWPTTTGPDNGNESISANPQYICSADYVNQIRSIDVNIAADIADDCRLALNAINTVFNNLVEQYATVGAPYESDKVRTYIASQGETKLWARSVHDFTQAALDQDQANPGSCPLPLTAAAPCGVLKGNYVTADPANIFETTSNGPVVYGSDGPGTEDSGTWQGYDQWRPAAFDEINDVIEAEKSSSATNSSATVGEILSDAGFDRPSSLIIVSNQHFDYNIPWSAYKEGETTPVMKFVDTRFSNGVVGSGDALRELAINPGPLCTAQTSHKTIWGTPVEEVGAASSNNFYDVDLDPCTDGEQKWSQDPGWHTTSYQNDTSQQYRWPVISSTSLSCTSDSGPTSSNNPAGVPTRCGNDFSYWFVTNIAEQPTLCDATTFGQCDTNVDPYGDQVDVQLTGAEQGEWSSPVRDGNVSVTFDPDQPTVMSVTAVRSSGGRRTVRSVTGKVLLDSVDGDGRATVQFAIRRAGGVIRIVDSHRRRFVVPVRPGSIEVAPNGTVSGKVSVKRRRGPFTLSWLVLDSQPRTVGETQ